MTNALAWVTTLCVGGRFMTSCKSKMSFGFHWKKSLPQRKVCDLVLVRIYACVPILCAQLSFFLALACIRNNLVCSIDIFILFFQTMKTDLHVNCVTNRSGIRVLKKFFFLFLYHTCLKTVELKAIMFVNNAHHNTVGYRYFFLNHKQRHSLNYNTPLFH